MIKGKEKVIIVSFYDDEKLDRSVKREEMLKKYCESKGYKVENLFRVMQYWETDYNLWTFRDCIDESIKGKAKCERIDKVIIYTTKELTIMEEEIVMYNALLNLYGVKLETIEEGILGKDMHCFSSITYDESIKEQNKEFIVNEDMPF